MGDVRRALGVPTDAELASRNRALDSQRELLDQQRASLESAESRERVAAAKQKAQQEALSARQLRMRGGSQTLFGSLLGVGRGVGLGRSGPYGPSGS